RIGLVLREAGCTAAGTWRAGAGMGFWSLWGARTIRLRYAVFALSLGRSRQRWLGTRACRRRLLLRARIVWGVRSLLAMLLWRLGGKRMRRGGGGVFGGGGPATTWRPRAFFLGGCRRRRRGGFSAPPRPRRPGGVGLFPFPRL